MEFFFEFLSFLSAFPKKNLKKFQKKELFCLTHEGETFKAAKSQAKFENCLFNFLFFFFDNSVEKMKLEFSIVSHEKKRGENKNTNMSQQKRHNNK